MGSAPIDSSKRAAELLVRPSVTLTGLLACLPDVPRGTLDAFASVAGDTVDDGQAAAPDSSDCHMGNEISLALRLPWSGREAPAEIFCEEREVFDTAEIQIKYAGYIEREQRVAEKIRRLENLGIPEDFDFQQLTALSMECRIKLERYRPRTIAQASRIPGVSPADISVLLVYFGR